MTEETDANAPRCLFRESRFVAPLPMPRWDRNELPALLLNKRLLRNSCLFLSPYNYLTMSFVRHVKRIRQVNQVQLQWQFCCGSLVHGSRSIGKVSFVEFDHTAVSQLLSSPSSSRSLAIDTVTLFFYKAFKTDSSFEKILKGTNKGIILTSELNK